MINDATLWTVNSVALSLFSLLFRRPQNAEAIGIEDNNAITPESIGLGTGLSRDVAAKSSAARTHEIAESMKPDSRPLRTMTVFFPPRQSPSLSGISRLRMRSRA